MFYKNGDRILAVFVTTEPTLIVGEDRELFEGVRLFSPRSFKDFDVTADGERFLMLETTNPVATSDETPPVPQIDIVMN